MMPANLPTFTQVMLSHTVRSPPALSFLSARAVLTLALLFLCLNMTHAQEQPSSTALADAQGRAERLDRIADILTEKTSLRDELSSQIARVGENASLEDKERLLQLNQDLSSLRTTFEIVALDGIDVDLSNDQPVDYDWRREMVDVVAPLLDSLKTLTKKPRQISELKEAVAKNNERLSSADKALGVLDSLSLVNLDTDSATNVQLLKEKWQRERETFEQNLLIASSQLERLNASEQSVFNGMWPAIKRFLLGRGLTLVFAGVAAVVAWVCMRLLWWAYSQFFTTKKVRRGSLWYRLLSYSYYILTIVVVILSVLAVLYYREDLLLLALAVVLIAAAALGLRQFIPAYIKEARLLLNLGAVREDERILYAGLPWQVMSLNLHSVLRNPALDGILRLPLESISNLVSRPVKDDTLWFPTESGDYVILPNDRFGQVISQTPELIQVSVKGGMIQTWPTAGFYAMSITNLSRGDSFGVAVTFGFDYALQPVSLTEVPRILENAVTKALKEAGFELHVQNLLVDLLTAGQSSLDYLIYVTMSSEVAGDYYGISRLVNKTCVSVANAEGWSIPYPQMVVHHQPIQDA